MSEHRFFLVGTPIGNLQDISARALDTLRSVDVIFAEDTRKTLSLLTHFSIKKKVISYHKDNEHSSAQDILNRLAGGESIALVSDAGMPGISDPGGVILRRLVQEGIGFSVIPGPVAFISALLSSGFDTSHCYFHGFLPHKKGEKVKVLEEISAYPTVIALYESVHRVQETLSLLLEYFPAPIACVREITKLHEETLFIHSAEDIEKVTLKGEFVLVADNTAREKAETAGGFVPETLVKKLSQEGFRAQDMVKVLKALGMKRNEAYSLVQELVDAGAEEESARKSKKR